MIKLYPAVNISNRIWYSVLMEHLKVQPIDRAWQGLPQPRKEAKEHRQDTFQFSEEGKKLLKDAQSR